MTAESTSAVIDSFARERCLYVFGERRRKLIEPALGSAWEDACHPI